MLWDIHIYNPKSKETATKVLEVPNTKDQTDVRVAYAVASKKFKVKQKYMLAVPHREDKKL